MALFGRRKDAAPKAVIAAAVPLSGPNAARVAKTFAAGQEDWQKEAWYHFDACGEFRSAITWVANAVSKADPVAIEIDPDTGKGNPSDDPRAQAAALAVFGDTTRRAQMLKTIATHWQVPGESWIIIHPKRGDQLHDTWVTVSGTKMIHTGGKWQYTDPFTGFIVQLTPQDRLMRLWSPHPNDGAKADSAARPALPILREIERSSQNVAARLDSRLAGNGILWIPQETDFPREPDQSLGEAVADQLLAAAEVGIRTPGTAAAQVPFVVALPGEMIGNIQHTDLSTSFDASVVDLRTEALRRLAATLDMPNETAEGSTGGMNHWGSWQVEESTYKIFIEPLLEAIGDAITQEWFRATLTLMGVPDASRFAIGWNTSSIVSRPDRTSELNELWDKGLISNEYLLTEAGVPEDAMPSEEEYRQRLLERIALANPASAAELLGLGIAAADVAQLPAADTAADRALPAAPDAAQRPDAVPDGLTAAAEVLVFDALSRAGKRLITRHNQAEFSGQRTETLYRQVPHERDPEWLLKDSFAFVDRVAENYNVSERWLAGKLERFTVLLLATRTDYDRAELQRALTDRIR